jgi:hypothetical protein
VAQEHVEAEGEEAEEQGRGRPEVDAEGVQVLAHLPARRTPILVYNKRGIEKLNWRADCLEGRTEN